MRGSIAIAGFLIVTAAPLMWLEAQSPPTNQTPPPAPTAPKPKPASKPAPGQDDSVPDAPAAGNAAGQPSTGSQDGGAASTAQPAATQQPAAQSPADSPVTDTAPAGSQTPAAKHSPSQDNPFPEEDSKAAAKDEDSTGASDQQPASTPDQASRPAAGGGSTGGSSSSRQGLDKLDLYGDKGKKGRNADPDAGLAYDPKLAKQDDKIGEFYMKNGNAPGAYARYKEASQHDAGDADAIFGMAEAARQMNMREEAAADYQTYLFAFPDGPKAPKAKKALAELKLQSKR